MYPPAAGGILTSIGKLPLPVVTWTISSSRCASNDWSFVNRRESRMVIGSRNERLQFPFGSHSFGRQIRVVIRDNLKYIYIYRILKMFFFAKQSILFFFFKFKFGMINFDGKIWSTRCSLPNVIISRNTIRERYPLINSSSQAKRTIRYDRYRCH